jgi:hypothetical protein
LLLSLAAFGLTVAVLSFISHKFCQKSNVTSPSKAVAIVDQKPAKDQADFPSWGGSCTVTPDLAEGTGVQLPSQRSLIPSQRSLNIKNIKTRVLSPAFMQQALCDRGIDISQPAETGAHNASSITQEQLRQALNIRVKPGATQGENQIILELTLNQNPDAAGIARALADRLVREYRTYWTAETRKAYLAASSQVNQAQQARRQALETLLAFKENFSTQEKMLQAFKDNVSEQEISAIQQQPPKTQSDRQSTARIADNPSWIDFDRKLKSLRQQEAAMLVNKTPLHPDVQDIRGRIADCERQIASTPRFAAEPPANNSSQGLISPAQVKSSPLNNEKENRESNARENIAAAVNQNQTAETLKQLQNAAERTEQQYLEKLLCEQKQFDISRKEPIFSVCVEPLAIANTAPGSNRGFIELMLCSGFAMAVGIGVFSSGLTTQPVLATIADLEPYLPVPIIGVIPGKDRSSDPIARRRRRAILRWTLILLGGLIVLGCIGSVYWFFIHLG